MVASAPFFERIRLQGNPKASADSVIVRGQARFTVLTSRLLRLEWSVGEFEDRATFAFPTREAATPPFNSSDEDGTLLIDTGPLQLRYKPDSGPFSAENLSITLELNGQPVIWKPGTPASGNLRGTRRTLDEAPGPVALSEGILSRDGWALFDDTKSVVFTEDGGWVAPRPDHDLLDWYFFGYGHDYLAAISEYTQFGGKTPLIPRFVLGAWWSRYWEYSDEDLKQLVGDFTAHDLPLDVLVVDMDWHTPDAWTGYTWNRKLFPDPPGFLKWVHDHGLRTTFNLHPAQGVQAFEEVYPDFARSLGFDPSKRETVEFRPGNREFMQQYFELLHHPMEEQGVDFWWLDWQQGESSDIQGLDPLPWLNHLHFLDSARRGQRPMLYSRWGGLGNHRYYIGFSGDTFSTWEALEFQPYFTATAANVLYGWWSHDIGGHMSNPSPELYARWVQYGALSPCLRLHSTKDPTAERRPWAFTEEAYRAAQAAFKLRYRMVPYLYTMAKFDNDTGVALCRPLYYAYPDSDGAYLAPTVYFLGNDILAAPIVQPANEASGLGAADVWIPPGTWYDRETGESYTGPRRARIFGDINRMPMLVREGGIIPFADLASTTDAIPNDHLTLEVFPGHEGSFRLYEDDGTTTAYLEGQAEWTPMHLRTDDAGNRLLVVGPTAGHCEGLPPQRSYEIRFMVSGKPEMVLIGGDEAEWSYDEATLTTVVQVPLYDKATPLAVRLMGAGVIDTALHNDGLVNADLKRMLGEALPQDSDNFIAAVAALDHPSRGDALARLGGPFIRVLENSVLPEAAQSLATVVVAAPSDGLDFEVSVEWTLHGGAGDEKQTQTASGSTQDVVLQCPFAVSGAPQPLRWEADVLGRWRWAEIREHYSSMTLFPAVSAWRVAVYDPSRQHVDPAAPGDLNWKNYEDDPARLPTLSNPFTVRLSNFPHEGLAADAARGAVAVTTINSNETREVRIAYGPLGSGSIMLNGQPVAEAKDRATLQVPPPMDREARVTVPVQLRAGENTLVLNLIPAPDAPPWEFVVGAALVDSDGAVVTGVSFQAPEQ